VIDDDPANRYLLSRRLQREGHRIATAANGATGLELARSGAFDLVRLDMIMPGLNSVADAKLTRARLNSSVLWIAGLLRSRDPMSGERVERRCGGIGGAYGSCSRLMGEDEEGTLAAPRAIRCELGDPKIGCRPPTLPAGCCAAANSIAKRGVIVK
jgi:hypothetical protein